CCRARHGHTRHEEHCKLEASSHHSIERLSLLCAYPSNPLPRSRLHDDWADRRRCPDRKEIPAAKRGSALTDTGHRRTVQRAAIGGLESGSRERFGKDVPRRCGGVMTSNRRLQILLAVACSIVLGQAAD